MSYICIKNLSVIFDRTKLFNNISLNIEKGSLIAITTPSSKGKTTFLNLINGNIKSENIFINGKLIDDKIKSKITFISNEAYNLYSKSVLEELLLVTNNLNKIKKYLKEFNIINCINKSPQDLSFVDVVKLDFIKALLNKSEIILFDDIFSYIDKYDKIELLGLIKKYQYENNITIIYSTTNIEDTMFCDKLIIIDKDLLFYDCVEKMYIDEKILKKSKINLSLEQDLIEKLKLYNIIDNTDYTVEDVVDKICK